MNALDYRSYQFLAGYIAERGYSPLQSEIADALGIAIEQVAEQMLRLWNQGYLCYPPHITGRIYLTTKKASLGGQAEDYAGYTEQQQAMAS